MERYNNSFKIEGNSSLKVSHLEKKWQQILEEERRSYSRNKKLLDDFDRVEQQIELFSRKRDSLKQAKHAFETYVSSVYPKWTKELKRLQESKRKNPNKEFGQTSSQGDKNYLRDKKHSANLLGGNENSENPIVNPAFCSTPHRNGVEEPAVLPHSVRKGTVIPEDHGYSGYHGNYPLGHPSFRMMHHSGWTYPDVWPAGMFNYVPRYPLPRQPFPMSWRNVPHVYEGHPSFMFDQNGSGDNPRTGSVHEGFSDHYQENPTLGRHDRRNTSDERIFREYYGNAQGAKYGSYYGARRPYENHGSPSRYDRNSHNVGTFQERHQDKSYRDAEYNDSSQQRRTSSEEQLIREGLDHDSDVKCSPPVKDIVDYGQINHDTFKEAKTPSRTVHQKNVDKTTKTAKVNVSHMPRSEDVPSLDQYSGEEENSTESSGVDHRTTDFSSESRTENNKSKEILNTESISLPTIHDFEGNIKDFYSSDTEKVSEAAPRVSSESRSSLLQKTSSKEKELQHSVSDFRTKPKDTSFNSQDKAGDTDDVLKTKEVKPNVVDDLLGDDLSDFEISGSEVSENIDEKKFVTNNEVSKHIPQELESTSADKEHRVSSADSVVGKKPSVDKSNVTSSETNHPNTKDPSDVNEVKELTAPTGTEAKPLTTTSATGTEAKQPAANSGTGTKVNSEDKEKFPGDIETEEKNKLKESSPSKDESVRQKSSPKENVLVQSSKGTEHNRLYIDDKTFLALLHMVDDDIEVSFSTELLYRHHGCTTDEKNKILRAGESRENWNQFDTAVISMVLLDQLPNIVRASGRVGLMTDQVLSEQDNCTNEKDFRETVDGSLTILWRNLFSHFLKMIQNNIMDAKEISEIFAPCLVSSECSPVDKAVSLLSRILSNPQDSVDDNEEEMSGKITPLSDEKDEEQSEREKSKNDGEKSQSDILEELSSSSDDSNQERGSQNTRKTSENRDKTKESISYSEDFEDEKSIPLTETDAYQKMLNSVKVSDEEDDIEEDFLAEGTMSEANSTGLTKQDSTQPPQKQTDPFPSSGGKTPTKTSKSKPKLSLFSSGERDELGNSLDNEHESVLGSSWKSSEISLSPPLSPDLDVGGYVPTMAGGNTTQGKKMKSTVKEPETSSKTDTVKGKEQESKTKSRIQAGFWNNSDSEDEVDLQVSHGATDNNGDDDDDFDFYS